MRRLAYLITLVSVAFAVFGTPALAASETSAGGGAGDQPPNIALFTEQATTAAPSDSTTQAGTLSEGEVIIQLGDNTIDSSQTQFKAGVLYRFKITNYGERPHDFYISEPVSIKGSFLGAMNGALLSVAKINPGQTVTVEFIFPTNATRKAWEFASLNKNMYEDGMRWAIEVV